MFSNLRMHGGSNHLFLPTGLVHRWMHDAPPSAVGHLAFAGGVVRVVHSNLSTLNAMYPGDLSGAFSERSRRRLAAAGHHPGFFVPMAGRTAGTDPGPPFTPRPSPLIDEGFGYVAFTLRALELRRVLTDARASAAAFSLTYTRLPGPEGNETWRASGRTRFVTLVEDGSGGRACTYAPSASEAGAPCSADELALLPDALPLAQGIGIHRLLFGKPYPVLPGWDEEFVCSE